MLNRRGGRTPLVVDPIGEAVPFPPCPPAGANDLKINLSDPSQVDQLQGSE